jgi:hypothetical protein
MQRMKKFLNILWSNYFLVFWKDYFLPTKFLEKPITLLKMGKFLFDFFFFLLTTFVVIYLPADFSLVTVSWFVSGPTGSLATIEKHYDSFVPFIFIIASLLTMWKFFRLCGVIIFMVIMLGVMISIF